MANAGDEAEPDECDESDRARDSIWLGLMTIDSFDSERKRPATSSARMASSGASDRLISKKYSDAVLGMSTSIGDKELMSVATGISQMCGISPFYFWHL